MIPWRPTPWVAVLLAGGAAAQGVLLDVPFVRQERDACGAACLTMVMRYWRAQGMGAVAEPEPEAIQRELYVPAERGIPGTAMRGYLERAGFHAFTVRGEWDDLVEHVGYGRPVIVCLSAPGRRLHYVVVAGVDAERGLVMINDPARRKLLAVSRAGFEKDWHASDYWTLVAAPAQRQ
jgi:predicted double-glycine peptidase